MDDTMKECYLEQYKILWNTLESELLRFWKGYHVLIAITLGIISILVAILTSRDRNVEGEFVIFLLLIIALVSTINVLLNIRAQHVYLDLLSAIDRLEQRFDEHFFLANHITHPENQALTKGHPPQAMVLANIPPLVILNISLLGTYIGLSFLLAP